MRQAARDTFSGSLDLDRLWPKCLNMVRHCKLCGMHEQTYLLYIDISCLDFV